MSIAVQTQIDNAVTNLSLTFNSMLNTGSFQYGCNNAGLYCLNKSDSSELVESSVTLATTDLGIKNPKHIRFLYIGIKTDNNFTISVKFDNSLFRDYLVRVPTKGLQRIRIPIGKSQRGRYLTLKVSSKYKFSLDKIEAIIVATSSGIVGY